MKIHKRILELRPEWTEKVKVVMTSGNKDPEEWADIIGGKAYKKELAKKFKDENDTMKIAIVVDMWLTGFDVPSLATMYVYKPMKDHNLMQAIARVNRVFPEKAGGLIVDYVGIAAALKDAMKRYTKRDQSNYGNNDIKDRAYSEVKDASYRAHRISAHTPSPCVCLTPLCCRTLYHLYKRTHSDRRNLPVSQ